MNTPKVGRSKRAELRRLYFAQRRIGWQSAQALRYARIEMEWNRAEASEIGTPSFRQVRLRAVPEEHMDVDNILCCCGERDCERRHRQPELERINRDGVWGIVGEYWNGEEWEQADSVWGFIGDDWRNSGYDSDVKRETLDAARKAHKCRACGRPKVA